MLIRSFQFTLYSVAVTAICLSQQPPQIATQPPTLLIGVRFGPGQPPCVNPMADCSSSQRQAMLKIEAGGGPEWGFVDQSGNIVQSGFRLVLSSEGQVGWGYVDREQPNKNGGCRPEDLLTPCLESMPVALGWTLVDSEGHIRRPPYLFGKSLDDEIKGQLPMLSDVGLFSEGLAAVSFEHKWGYVDELGHTAIPGRYDAAGPFSEGLAPVRLPAKVKWHGSSMETTLGEWTFINRRGVRIGANFVDVDRFALGLAPVTHGKGWGYANKKGRVVIPEKYAAARPFSENLAATRIDGYAEDNDGLYPRDYSGHWGYIDRTGKVIIEHQFSRALPFREGLASVCKLEHGESRCGAIDATGTTRIPFVYRALTPFTAGIALARNLSGKRVFIDHEGRPISGTVPQDPVEFEDARLFRAGVAPVKQGGLWGFIDRTGRMIVAPQFLNVAPDWPGDEWDGDYWFMPDLYLSSVSCTEEKCQIVSF
jgi:WG containing repeat